MPDTTPDAPDDSEMKMPRPKDVGEDACWGPEDEAAWNRAAARVRAKFIALAREGNQEALAALKRGTPKGGDPMAD